MGFPNVVCPNEPSLLKKLNRFNLAIRIFNPEEIIPAVDNVKSSDNNLDFIILESQISLDEIPFDEKWKGLSLALYVSGMGSYRNIIGHMSILTQSCVRVYLSADKKENLTAAQILSSVGVTCYIIFDSGTGTYEWEALKDLMTYALFSPIKHAPIEPFSQIANNYNHRNLADWSMMYFENPKYYLHLDNNGQVALSHQKLIEGSFIEDDIYKVKDLRSYQDFIEMQDSQVRLFLDNHECSRCRGWRLCVGRFSENNTQFKKIFPACSDFFTEFIDTVEDIKSQHKP